MVSPNGSNGKRPWYTHVEVECPECSEPWTVAVTETSPGLLRITAMHYGCDHRAVLSEIEDTAVLQAKEEADAHYRELADEAAVRGV